MHDSLRSFLAKLSLSCLWQGPSLDHLSMLKLVWKWKLWPELHSQNERADDWIPGKGLWFQALWKRSVIVPLILLSRYGPRQSGGSCSGSCGTSVQRCTETSAPAPESLGSTDTLGMVTPNIKPSCPYCPCLEAFTCVSSLCKCLSYAGQSKKESLQDEI